MMKKALFIVGFLVATNAQADDSFEYHGYMRSGIGSSRGGADQVCFKAPGASSMGGAVKFRLGNECETFLEAAFTKKHKRDDNSDKPMFSTNFRMAFVSNGDKEWESTSVSSSQNSEGEISNSADLTLALREAYVNAESLFGSTGLWAGKRFYARDDIHMIDFYFLSNAGPGFGFENTDLGIAKLHVAATRNTPSSDSDGPAQTNFDLRLTDIELAGGQLMFVYIYGTAGERGAASGQKKWQALSGQQASLIYKFDMLGGFLKTGLQYGVGLFGASGGESRLNDFGAAGAQAVAIDDNDAFDAAEKSSTLRFFAHQVSEFGKTLSNALLLYYQDAHFGGLKNATKEVPNVTEISAGLRPIYHATEKVSIALEYGVNSVQNAILVEKEGEQPEWKSAQLQKLTLAPQVALANNYWARPVIRVFFTQAMWNEDAKGKIAENVYGDETEGFSTGVQVEAWW